MANARRVVDHSNDKPRPRRATTPEAREQQLIALAVDLAEKQMLDGTASAQVVTHYLKLGSTREKLEQKKIEREIHMLQIKADDIASAARSEELYANALKAMRRYSGQDTEEEEYEG